MAWHYRGTPLPLSRNTRDTLSPLSSYEPCRCTPPSPPPTGSPTDTPSTSPRPQRTLLTSAEGGGSLFERRRGPCTTNVSISLTTLVQDQVILSPEEGSRLHVPSSQPEISSERGRSVGTAGLRRP
ncbi:hypothetical protein RvY_12126-2 [Ramazzottius varieornatus]|uniref:Uncharacterized protein n=1 Tax=Ramazzottius varieornatus TaxID=947166 RepID=A0A1D1VIC5_RAMVA|nr:hypothetical protein RvY_12126-2 [Ramazzottius varieornatus]